MRCQTYRFLGSFLCVGVCVLLISANTAFSGTLTDFQQATIAIAKKANPAIVKILRQQKGIKGPEGVTQLPVYPNIDGAGEIIAPEGYIVTNYHVIGYMDSVYVELLNGERYYARIIGMDKSLDIALLKIDVPYPLPYLRLNAEDPLEQGELVFAIGNPFELTYSLSFGVISGTSRIVNSVHISYIQTDAAVNGGNSGGALLNIYGDMVGMVTLNVPLAQSMGFAIPAKAISKAIPVLLSDGKIEHAYLGVKFNPDNAFERVGISYVRPGGPAEKAGIRKGDIVAAINGKKVAGQLDIFSITNNLKPGAAVELEIVRNQDTHLDVILVLWDRLPDEDE